MSRARRSRGASLGFLGMLGALAFTGGLVALWRSLPDDPARKAARAPASIDPAAATDPKRPKTVEELSREAQEKSFKQRQSKEWAAIRAGEIDAVLADYAKHESASGLDREKRATILGALGKALRPRAAWPTEMPAMNDAKLLRILDFLEGVLNGPPRPGAEPTLAMASLMEIVRTVPDFRPKVERAILKFHARDARPGPKGDCLLALGELGSPEGLALAVKAVDSSDTAINRAAVYALGAHVKQPATAKRAAAALGEIVARRKASWPLAVKILANQGHREVASVVPELLRKNASPIEVETAAFVVEKLKIKEYRERMLERLGTENDPHLRQSLDAALSASH